MKTNLSTLLVSAALVVMTGCGDKGGSGGGGTQAAIPGIPQGRISAVVAGTGVADPNNYCDIAADQKSMICTSIIGNLTCPSQTIVFSDQASMCSALTSALQTNIGALNGQCGANSGRSAMLYAQQTYCAGIGTNGTVIPGQGGQVIPPNIGGGNINQPLPNLSRVIRCDVQASYIKDGRWVDVIYTAANATVLSTARTKGSVNVGDCVGRVNFALNPRGDKLTLNIAGLNGDTEINQTVGADQEMRFDADIQNYKNSIKLGVFCRDFSNQVPMTKNISSYSCKGVSRIGSNHTHKINKMVSIDELGYGQVELADGVTIGMKTSAAATTGLNSTLITLEAVGISGVGKTSDNTMLSSASIYSPVQIKMDDGAYKVDVVCQPKR